jgi:hypothetical protein
MVTHQYDISDLIFCKVLTICVDNQTPNMLGKAAQGALDFPASDFTRVILFTRVLISLHRLTK